MGENDPDQSRNFSGTRSATKLNPATTSAPASVISSHNGRRWRYVLAIAGSDLAPPTPEDSRIFLTANTSSSVDAYRPSGFLAMHRWTTVSSATGTFALREAIGLGSSSMIAASVWVAVAR